MTDNVVGCRKVLRGCPHPRLTIYNPKGYVTAATALEICPQNWSLAHNLKQLMLVVVLSLRCRLSLGWRTLLKQIGNKVKVRWNEVHHE